MLDENILNKIKNWTNDKPQPAGISTKTALKVSDYCKENFGCCLPDGYIEFLNTMNGFDYDDRKIFCCYNAEIEDNFPRYASLDLVTFNKNFYENTDITEYIILGKSSIDYIGYIKATDKYVIMTNGTLDHLEEFDTFSELLIKFFELS